MDYTDDEIGEITESYGMDPAGITNKNAVRAWLDHCYQETFYTLALIMACVYEGVEGIFVAVSTAASAAQQNMNVRQRVIVKPHYYLYEVWFHPNVVPFNFKGLGWGGYRVGNFEEVLQSFCMRMGIQDWRLRYAPLSDEYHDQNLARLLGALGICYHIRIMSGLSKSAFRALDVYTRVVASGDAPPAYEAHDVVFSHWNPLQRRVPEAPDWWVYTLRQHIGQASLVAEWYLRRGASVGAMQGLLDRYVQPGQQIVVLDELTNSTGHDLSGTYRVLVTMSRFLDPDQNPHHRHIMEPLQNLIAYTVAQGRIQRSIEDRRAERDIDETFQERSRL